MVVVLTPIVLMVVGIPGYSFMFQVYDSGSFNIFSIDISGSITIVSEIGKVPPEDTP